MERFGPAWPCCCQYQSRHRALLFPPIKHKTPPSRSGSIRKVISAVGLRGQVQETSKCVQLQKTRWKATAVLLRRSTFITWRMSSLTTCDSVLTAKFLMKLQILTLQVLLYQWRNRTVSKDHWMYQASLKYSTGQETFYVWSDSFWLTKKVTTGWFNRITFSYFNQKGLWQW